MEQVNIAALIASLDGDNRGLLDLLDGDSCGLLNLLARSVSPHAEAPPTMPMSPAQIAAQSFPRPLGKVGPASPHPLPPPDSPPRKRAARSKPGCTVQLDDCK